MSYDFKFPPIKQNSSTDYKVFLGGGGGGGGGGGFKEDLQWLIESIYIVIVL